MDSVKRKNKVGKNNPFYGRKHTDEYKEKISRIHKGKIVSQETRKKISEGHRGKKPWNKGLKGIIKHSKEARKKMSEARKGKKRPTHAEKMRGREFTEEHRRKIGEAHRGEKCNFWKGGLVSINAKIRASLEMKIWREAVFKRDNWTCVWCSQKGGKLHADHIKPFALFPELRFAIDNGRTLCVSCHRKTDTWGRKSNKINK